jgi:hypothetical protein
LVATKLPQTQGKTVMKTAEMLKLKKLLWKKAFNGVDVYHLNAGERGKVETKKEETKQEKITKVISQQDYTHGATPS